MDNWAGVYAFSPVQDLTTRVRRLERGEQYLRGGQLVTPSGKYAGVPTTLLDGSRVDLTSPDLTMNGSIPPFGVVGNFGFSATTTSITMFWDGTNGSAVLRIIRADGSAVQIPGSSLTVSGLSSSTTYGFLPFWSVANNCGLGFVKGDSGSPQFAFSSAAMSVQASIQQSLQDREPLTAGFITFATPASGTNSGGGTSGGTGGGTGPECVMLGTDIEPVGDWDYSTVHHRNSKWIHLEAKGYPRSLNCTPDHPLYHAERGKMQADQFKLGDWVITDAGEKKLCEVRPLIRVCTKVQVKMREGHLFWANGFLSHNVKYREPL